MNLPNKLTLLRVVMIPLFLIFLCIPLPIPETASRLIAAAIFGAAALTDLLDGKIARKYHLITDFGKLMDPLADKCMVISAMLGILVFVPQMQRLFVWAVAIMIFRELAVTSLRLLAASKGGEVIAAAWLGKVKTVTQIVCVLTVLLEPVFFPFDFVRTWLPLSWLTTLVMTVMTVWSGISYFVSYRKYLR